MSRKRTGNQAREGVLARCSACGEQKLVFVPAIRELIASFEKSHCKTCKAETMHGWWNHAKSD